MIRRWLDRPDLWLGLAVAALGALVFLPRLGGYPLWDPWEPHYTQVAWEMRNHATWMDPWYRDADDWWSKPILMLWMLRASLAALWDPIARFHDVELAARLPFALTAMGGAVLHFDWSRRLFGRAVGLVGALALLTAPMYVLIGRQVMADMPFVVAYSAGLGYLAVGMFTERRIAPASTRPVDRAVAWVRREWPFIAFWVLEALAVLAKGFLPPVLVVLVAAAYWIVTFRARDYAGLSVGRRLGPWLLRRGALSAAVLGAAGLAVWALPDAHADERGLYAALIVATAALAVFLWVWRDTAPSRHALSLLERMRAGWGLPLLLAVAAPWFVFMSLAHGFPYWREFIYYHHLGRAAGTIDKPGGTFDLFVRQLGFGMFPWSAFLPLALVLFVRRSSAVRSVAERRNVFVLLAFLLPYLFFTLSATKFAHYIFPVVPFGVVLAASALVWLGRRGEPWVPLGESAPALGPPVPATAGGGVWWRGWGARGDLVAAAALTLVTFGILAHDLAIDFRLFLRLFLYYGNRATPPGYQPFILLQLLYAPAGVAIGLWLVSRWVRRAQVAVIGASALAVACYLSWVTLPAMGATFSYEPLVRAYERLARPGDPLGQFNDWQQPERSVLFLSQNRCVHLRTPALTREFLSRPGRKFILVDRDRLADLRKVAHEAGSALVVVADDHPYARLLSTEPSPETAAEVKTHLFHELPPGVTFLEASFGSIHLLGYRVDPLEVRSGGTAHVSLYFRADAPVADDWDVLVHADNPASTQNRLRFDHEPLGGRHPTSAWRPGEVVEDVFDVSVPPDYPFTSFFVWIGLTQGERRLPLALGAPSDGENRVRGPLVRVRRD
jgi:4-amino-4-deoxy-L-arabinose transferase-like glycosyltransferase